MSEEPNHAVDEQPRRRLSPVAVVFVLLGHYPLSAGPMIKIVDWSGLGFWESVNFLGTIYFPIVWVAARVPWFHSLFGWYLSFFKG